jgi:adenylate kinase
LEAHLTAEEDPAMAMEGPSSEPLAPLPTLTDLEIKDAFIIFAAVWADLDEAHGRDMLRFPREFIWLGGAPGAGKGTNTPFIARARDITAPPVVISNLLTSPQAVAIKNAGKMVGDREVIGLLFEELLKPEYRDGVVIDGFPRTKVQVECLKMFHQAVLEQHNEYRSTVLSKHFRKPMFRTALLFVSEEVSVQRQLRRGLEIKEHNRQVRMSGMGELLEERVTDTDAELCRNRYRTFKESTFDALQSLRQFFHFHFIDAEGNLEQVQQNIIKEFSYQSSLELPLEVFEAIRNIPIASNLLLHARQALVERLEEYVEDQKPLFQKVIKLVEDKMIPIVSAHAMSGFCRFNSEDELLDDPLALRMMIDILSERGFHAAVDIHKMDVPLRVNPDTWEIISRTKRVYRIEIRYATSDIRRGP